MADAIVVLPPGFRVTDSDTGAPISGAVIYFFDAGTSTPKTVYADEDLLTALGTSVTCDSLGYPTSNGTTKTLVYTDTSSYKIRIDDASGNVISTHDNVKGAIDTSGFGGSGSVTASFPVVTKSLDYTVVTGDQNKTIAVNCSSADVTLTLPSAVTAGDGWGIKVQHAGTANQAIIATVSSQTITEGSKSFGTSYSLFRNGEDLHLISDGGNWRVVSHTPPFVKNATGVIPVVDRLASPPGAPVQGSAYIVTSSPSGDWSTFSQHDIALYTGAGWVALSPFTDCGWIAWVADEDLQYIYRGTAWVAESASDTQAGTIEIAVQSEMETATDTGRAVPPGRQQYHPGHPKCWGKVAVSGGTPSISASYNMTSITDSGTGFLTGTIATDFSSANWALTCSYEWGSATGVSIEITSQAAGTFAIKARDSDSNSAVDPDAWHFVGHGDQ